MNRERVTVIDPDEMVGNLLSPIGSPTWCAGMRTEAQKYLDQHKMDHEGLTACIAAITKHEVWKHVKDAKGKPFASYSVFCKTPRPFGLGRDPNEIDALIAEGAAKRTAQAMAADETVEPLKGHGGAREQDSNATLNGRGAEYLVARLKRDHPAIAAALANGEYPSARAAGIAAGIVRVSTPLDTMKRAWRKASEAERQAFSNWIFTEEATK